MQYITDMYGKLIEVTDLAKAIAQADNFCNYQIEGEETKEFNQERKAYWNDLLRKLQDLSADPENRPKQ